MDTVVSLRRAVGKAKRAIRRPRLVRWQFDQAYYAKLGRHAELTPLPTAFPVDLLAALHREHVVTVDGSAYFDQQVIADADQMAGILRCDRSTSSTVEVPIETHLEHPSVYRWGLADAQLDLAEWYIGLPVQFLGVTIKLERADATARDTRQWHRDVEDRRMLKLITYLSDVDDGGGPLGYLDRRVSDAVVDRLAYWSGFVSEARLEAVLPQEHWRVATGPKLTTTFIDTCRILHRATPPTTTDRYSMTFSYCSQRPFQRFDEMLPSRTCVENLTAGMPPRQVRAAAHTVG